ncbi:uncharacterized [Tachysurus ichikawai]
MAACALGQESPEMTAADLETVENSVLQLPPLFNPAPGTFSLKMFSHDMPGFAKCWHTNLDWNKKFTSGCNSKELANSGCSQVLDADMILKYL